MIYRINGKRVTREEFMKNAKGFDYSGGAAPLITTDIQPYRCPVTGRPITSRSAHRENLKQTGCRILEPGETESFKKNKAREVEAHSERAADFLSDRIAERWHGPAD